MDGRQHIATLQSSGCDSNPDVKYRLMWSPGSINTSKSNKEQYVMKFVKLEEKITLIQCLISYPVSSNTQNNVRRCINKFVQKQKGAICDGICHIRRRNGPPRAQSKQLKKQSLATPAPKQRSKRAYPPEGVDTATQNYPNKRRRGGSSANALNHATRKDYQQRQSLPFPNFLRGSCVASMLFLFNNNNKP